MSKAKKDYIVIIRGESRYDIPTIVETTDVSDENINNLIDYEARDRDWSVHNFESDDNWPLVEIYEVVSKRDYDPKPALYTREKEWEKLKKAQEENLERQQYERLKKKYDK